MYCRSPVLCGDAHESSQPKQRTAKGITTVVSKACHAITSYNTVTAYIQGVTGGTDQTSGECSLGHTIPI